MTPPKREVLLLTALLAVLAIASVWSTWASSRASASAVAAEDRLASVAGLTARIEALRERPERTRGVAMPVERLAATIESAATSAGIEPRKLVRVDPQPPRAVADQPYEVHRTDVQLEGVELTDALSFLDVIAAAEDGQLAVGSLRFTAPRRGSGGWRLSVTLRQTIYKPRSDV